MWIWLILKNISLLDRIWSLWLVPFAHSPTNFIFWLGRLIFSVSINSHPDNIYVSSRETNIIQRAFRPEEWYWSRVIRHMIRILPCFIHFNIYLNRRVYRVFIISYISTMPLIIHIFFIFLNVFNFENLWKFWIWNFEILWNWKIWKF
jgi:hypothetical protein